MERAKISSKDFFTQWIVVEIKFAHIRGDGFIAGSHLLKPDPVMTPERFAHGKANQAGAVALFGIPLTAGLIELKLGNRGEPAAEAVTILIGAQFFNVGDAVVVGVHEWTRWTGRTWRTYRLIDGAGAVPGICFLPAAYCLGFEGGCPFKFCRLP